MLNESQPDYSAIVEKIRRNLPPKYDVENKSSVMGGLVDSVARMLHVVKTSLQELRNQVFIKTASGSVKYGYRTQIQTITGIRVIYVSHKWDHSIIELKWNSVKRLIQLTGYPEIFIEETPNDYDLTENQDIPFLVYCDYEKMPDTTDVNTGGVVPPVDHQTMVETLVFDEKRTVDYLGELCANRKVKREKIVSWDGLGNASLVFETDDQLRGRALNLGAGNTRFHIQQSLEYFLGNSNFTLSEWDEKWETPAVLGMSFVGYSGQAEVTQGGYVSEHNFGAHYVEESTCLLRFVINLDDSIPPDLDEHILKWIEKVRMHCITPQIVRRISSGGVGIEENITDITHELKTVKTPTSYQSEMQRTAYPVKGELLEID